MAEIKTFATCTDEELTQYLKMHYAGKINIADYWHVGDTRKIHLNSIESPNPSYYNKTWSAQDITIVITALNHHDLATPINGNSKAAITCQTREVLNNISDNNRDYGSVYVDFDSSNDESFKKWSQLPLRTWLNSTFFNTCFSNEMQGLIKETKHLRLTRYNSRTTEEVIDKIFLPSYPEIYGNVTYLYYINNANPNNAEGTQWEYYKNPDNLIKYGNNNGTPNDLEGSYFIGSPGSDYDSSNGYEWCITTEAGKVSSVVGRSSYYLAPAFCLAAEPDPEPSHKLIKNGKIIEGIAKNGKKLLGIAHNGELIWKYEDSKYPIPADNHYTMIIRSEDKEISRDYTFANGTTIFTRMKTLIDQNSMTHCEVIIIAGKPDNPISMNGAVGSNDFINFVDSIETVYFEKVPITGVYCMLDPTSVRAKYNFKKLSFRNWDTSQVTNMNNCFRKSSSSYSNMTDLDIRGWNFENVTTINGFLDGQEALTNLKTDSEIDLPKVTEASDMFMNCSSLITIPKLNFSVLKIPYIMFNGCKKLETIPEMNWGAATDVLAAFENCTSLKNLGGFKDYGKAFSKSEDENYSSYKLDLSASTLLTHDSLMNVINGLYDIASKGVKPQILSLGTENLAKLSEGEKQIAQNKGWTLT